MWRAAVGGCVPLLLLPAANKAVMLYEHVCWERWATRLLFPSAYQRSSNIYIMDVVHQKHKDRLHHMSGDRNRLKFESWTAISRCVNLKSVVCFLFSASPSDWDYKNKEKTVFLSLVRGSKLKMQCLIRVLCTIQRAQHTAHMLCIHTTQPDKQYLQQVCVFDCVVSICSSCVIKFTKM